MDAAGPNYTPASLHVSDLHPEVTEAMLFEKFSTAGPIVSIRVCRDIASRRSLGYAYVNFQQPADAERALDTMNFDAIKGRPICIMWSQRDTTLRRSGLGNVFIKNLDKSIDNKAMYDTFSAFGNILACKVATDKNGENLGYGFVHFETEESALKAIKKVNGILLNGRKVFVGKFIPHRERSAGTGDHARKFTSVYIKNFGVELEEDDLRKICETYGKILSLKIMTDMEGNSRGFGFVSFESHEAAAVCVEDLNGKEHGGRQLFAGRAQKKSESSAELCARFDAIRQETPEAQQIQQAVHVPGLAPLTAQMLAQAQPHEQKQMLGERLFSIIQQSHGDVAGKITGMLLEMDNAELLHMLESEESLKAKINEALCVLAVH